MQLVSMDVLILSNRSEKSKEKELLAVESQLDGYYRIPTDNDLLIKWRKLGISLLKEFGLRRKGWVFQFTKSHRQLGFCSRNLKVIGLSSIYARTCKDDALIEDTIRHEIGHALCSWKAGHGKEWQDMGKVVGYNPKRTKAVHDMSVLQKRYIAFCPRGHSIERYGFRKPTKIRSCAKCDPEKYNEAYRFIWHEWYQGIY